MEHYIKIKLNDKLYLRDPEETELGKRILQHSIILIQSIGFEAFTFKKLAKEIQTTEASVYRYFENKHRLLLYLVDWYWSWLEYRLMFEIKNVEFPEFKIKKAIQLLSTKVVDDASFGYINESILFEIVLAEGAKAYLTKHVKEDNKAQLFKPYKDLCNRIADFVIEYNSNYKYPHSLASTIIETSHTQNFYLNNLPSLTDFGQSDNEGELVAYLEELVFTTIKL